MDLQTQQQEVELLIQRLKNIKANLRIKELYQLKHIMLLGAGSSERKIEKCAGNVRLTNDSIQTAINAFKNDYQQTSIVQQ